MNRENIEYCIELMRNAKNLDMGSWQQQVDVWGIVSSIEDLHACGNTACFAGYVAISPKFQADGGELAAMGQPKIVNECADGYYIGEEAIADWLDIDYDLANKLVNGDLTSHPDRNVLLSYSRFYNKTFIDVTPDDVIDKLNDLLKG